MEKRVEREEIEKLLKEIKVRMGSGNEDMAGIIKKHPLPILLAAFGAGVILSQIDDYLIENIETGRSYPSIEGIMKLGLPLIIKKFIR